MRFFFLNLKRAKLAAKRLTRRFPEIPLSASQRGVANALGYLHWHSIEREHNAAPPSALDQDLPTDEARRRWTNVTLALSKALNLPDGDIQSVLDDLRLTGNRRLTFEDHEAVRTACWRLGPLPNGRRRMPGTTCIITDSRRRSTRRRAYVRQVVPNMFGDRPVEIISDLSAGHGGRADFEVICPRVPVTDFVPLCLWLPYGWCVLGDGTELLFSREYHPLWKIRPDGKVERALPWESPERPFFYFNNLSGLPWANEATKSIAMERLAQHNIAALPMLADALPILINNPSLGERQAINVLRDPSLLVSEIESGMTD